VLHSRLTERERLAQWKRIQEGGADVVIGARSALFAPLPNLGLIVVDEEHETSFKQQSTPHYHAREAALKRAEIEGALVMLGSATPSMEAFALAREGRLEVLTLPERVGGRKHPKMAVVDLNLERPGSHTFLSIPLLNTMSQALRRKEQVILFLNRRGFFPVVFCTACRNPVRCLQCDISLTLHRKANRLICHYCGQERLPPSACPACQSPKLRFIGAGTERVEHEVRRHFPQARLLRMDSDTMIARDAHEKALERFKKREVDILIGTQMIAKGLDFPHVTLVGVVAADLPLHQPDFRASERTYQLLAQVSGRAGRGDEPGLVIVQTAHADHYSIRCALKNDYARFAEQELAMRESSGYPPHSRLLRAILSGEDAVQVEAQAHCAAQAIEALGLQGLKVLGPARAPIAMINKRHRWHMLIKSPEPALMDRVAHTLPAHQKSRRGSPSKPVRMILDADPVSML